MRSSDIEDEGEEGSHSLTSNCANKALECETLAIGHCGGFVIGHFVRYLFIQ